MAKVFLGVGHGGIDSGAVGVGGALEKALNLSIALYTRSFLAKHGVTVIMSRTEDENDSLEEEIRECNEASPDLAVDIHNNASPYHTGDGFEAYYHYKGGVSKDLAENIEAEVIKLGQNSRGCKTRLGDGGLDFYGFIRETVCPAVIIECCFIDNEKDITILDTVDEQKAFGEAIAKGVLKTLNIQLEEDEDMSRFNDVPDSHWGNEAIEKLADKGIINGYEGGIFKPGGNITRAELCVMLARMDSRYDKGKQYLLSLSDVASDAWYANEVNFCIEAGIIKGYLNMRAVFDVQISSYYNDVQKIEELQKKLKKWKELKEILIMKKIHR